LLKGEVASATIMFEKAALRNPAAKASLQWLADSKEGFKLPQTASGFLSVIIIFFLLSCHEFAHGWMASQRGDDTARNEGRLTLNPLAHIDLFGSVILPGILIMRGTGFVFGWAKPVPVNPENFSDKTQDHMAVAFAGPGINLVIGLICAISILSLAFVIRLLFPQALAVGLGSPAAPIYLFGVPGSAILGPLVLVLKTMMYTSFALGIFNLIPVPPLDGSWIFSGLLPGWAKKLFEALRPLGFILFLVVIMTPILDLFILVGVGFWLYAILIFLGFMGFPL